MTLLVRNEQNIHGYSKIYFMDWFGSPDPMPKSFAMEIRRHPDSPWDDGTGSG
jgi:hypothetical protein